MRNFAFTLSLLTILILSACTLPAPGGNTPTAEEAMQASPTPQPTDASAPTQEVQVAPATQAPESEATATLVAANTNTPLPPTNTPAPTEAQAVNQAQEQQATATSPAPTSTSTPGQEFDPYSFYGEPDYENKMTFASFAEWAQAETQTLPDNRDIRLRFIDGVLTVTGKRRDFSTWWFSYHTLEDFYLEMTFDSETCGAYDAYGMIFRGPPHLAGVSYGYVVSFTCDGQLWVFRLDGADPWEAENLIDVRVRDEIDSGSNRQNVIGVRAEGDHLVIVANGTEVAEVVDDEFSRGRVGVFVRPGSRANYTYRVTNFAYWKLGEE